MFAKESFILASRKYDNLRSFRTRSISEFPGSKMRSIRPEIEVVRDKAFECESAAEFARDKNTRAICRKRAKLYRELVSEVELTMRRSKFDELRVE